MRVFNNPMLPWDVITTIPAARRSPAEARVEMPSGESLVIGMFAGVFGVAYFVYGKRTGKFTWLITGVLLCVYPYLIESVLWLSVVGVLLLAAPFAIDRWS